MADTKTTALTENTAPILTDVMYIIDDPGGSAASQKVTLTNVRRLVSDYAICNGRLTLETGVPISTADQTAKTTLYFTPYKGSRIGLYDGSATWTILPFTELSLNISAYTANKNYDIWVYNNSGTAALDSTIWTDDTNRATALTTQDGIYVKTAATTRRYVGTIRITGTTGQCEDSDQYRYVWNYYNRVSRKQYKADTSSHSYTTGTYRVWNNTATNAIFFVIGAQEEVYSCGVNHSVTGAVGMFFGAGLDSATPPEDCKAKTTSTGAERQSMATMFETPVGYHYICASQYGVASATWSGFALYGSFVG